MANSEQVIISQTSFPMAIPYAARAILKGSVLPNNIILYLTFTQFGKAGIPQKFLQLAADNPINT